MRKIKQIARVVKNIFSKAKSRFVIIFIGIKNRILNILKPIFSRFKKAFNFLKKITKKLLTIAVKVIATITLPVRKVFKSFREIVKRTFRKIKLSISNFFSRLYKLKFVKSIVDPIIKLLRYIKKIYNFKIFVLVRKVLKVVVLLIFITLIIVGAFAGIGFLRYRQTCGYNSYAGQTQITQVNQEFEACPNLLSKEGILSFIKNIFNFDPEVTYAINSKFNSENVVTDEACRDPNGLTCLLSQMNGDLKRERDRTNVLIAGSDSRTEGIKGNTDTVMFLSYFHPTGQVMMVSFPRDLVVRHRTPQGWTTMNRINEIFNSYGYYDESVGVQALNMAVSQVFDQPIHYYLYINFNVFNRIVDSLGSIDIYLDEPFRDAFPCNESHGFPNLVKYSGNTDYCVFEFPQGWNTFNWMRANIYSRARYLSSDYSRVARQQKTMEAIMAAAISKTMTVKQRFDFAVSMFSEVLPQIRTNAGIEDIVGIFKIVKNLKTNAARIVIDPASNNHSLVYAAPYDETFRSHQKLYDYSYGALRNYVNDIWNNLSFYIDQPRIRIINGSVGIPGESSLAGFINSSPKFSTISRETRETLTVKGIRVYNLTGKKGAADEIKRRIPEIKSYSAFVDDIVQSEWKEDFLIIYNP